MNMILVIIIDTYSFVKSNNKNSTSKLHVIEFLRIFIINNFKRYKFTDWILTLMFDKLSIRLYCVEDVQRELLKRGFNDDEIESLMLKKYRLEPSDQIDEYLVKDIILGMMQSTGKLYEHELINEKNIKYMKNFCQSDLFAILNYDLQKINNFLALLNQKISQVSDVLDEEIKKNE